MVVFADPEETHAFTPFLRQTQETFVHLSSLVPIQWRQSAAAAAAVAARMLMRKHPLDTSDPRFFFSLRRTRLFLGVCV